MDDDMMGSMAPAEFVDCVSPVEGSCQTSISPNTLKAFEEAMTTLRYMSAHRKQMHKCAEQVHRLMYYQCTGGKQ